MIVIVAKCPGRVILESEKCVWCSNEDVCRCGKCVVRCSNAEFRDDSGICISCSDPKAYRASETECDKCDNRLMQDGKCYPCSYLENISTDASKCKKCSNRKMKDGNSVLSKKVPNILIGLCLVVLLVMINIILIIK